MTMAPRPAASLGENRLGVSLGSVWRFLGGFGCLFFLLVFVWGVLVLFVCIFCCSRFSTVSFCCLSFNVFDSFGSYKALRLIFFRMHPVILRGNVCQGCLCRC